jgi:hypothetical protein
MANDPDRASLTATRVNPQKRAAARRFKRACQPQGEQRAGRPRRARSRFRNEHAEIGRTRRTIVRPNRNEVPYRTGIAVPTVARSSITGGNRPVRTETSSVQSLLHRLFRFVYLAQYGTEDDVVAVLRGDVLCVPKTRFWNCPICHGACKAEASDSKSAYGNSSVPSQRATDARASIPAEILAYTRAAYPQRRSPKRE